MKGSTAQASFSDYLCNVVELVPFCVPQAARQDQKLDLQSSLLVLMRVRCVKPDRSAWSVSEGFHLAINFVTRLSWFLSLCSSTGPTGSET